MILPLFRHVIIVILFRHVIIVILPAFLLWTARAEALPDLQRGINLNRPFLEVQADINFPGEVSFVEWDENTTDSVLRQLRRDGFRSIRLLVNLEPLISAERHRLREQNLLIRFVQRCASSGFAVVVTLYSPDLFQNDVRQGPVQSSKFPLFLTAVSSLAGQLAMLPGTNIALEPVNEPPPPCVWSKSQDWSAFQRMIFAEIRRAAPRLTVVLTGACWGSIDGLLTVNPQDFDNFTIYSFHFYEPYLFTHQGIEYEKGIARYISQLDYPAQVVQRADIESRFLQSVTKSTKSDATNLQVTKEGMKEIERYFQVEGNAEYISKRFALVRAWAKSNNIPGNRILLGEFGVTGGGNPAKLEAPPSESREWLREVRAEAENSKYGWAIYSLISTFGIKDGLNDPIFYGVAETLNFK